MKKLIYILMLATAIVSAGCVDEGELTESDMENDDSLRPPPQVCYVLCDFSTSQSDASRQKIKKDALNIFQTAALKCKLKYYEISAPKFDRPFFEYTELMKDEAKSSSKRNMKADTALKRVMLDSLLLSKSSLRTCIIQTINTVAEVINQEIKNKKTRIAIIILSDMLEACDAPVKLNINDKITDADLQAVEQMEKPRFGFSGYEHLTINLVGASTKDPDANLLAFWTKVLLKYGYSFNDAITANLPEWKKSK